MGSWCRFRVLVWIRDLGMGMGSWCGYGVLVQLWGLRVAAGPRGGCRTSGWAQKPRTVQDLGIRPIPTSRGPGAIGPPPRPPRARSTPGAWQPWRRPAVREEVTHPQRDSGGTTGGQYSRGKGRGPARCPPGTSRNPPARRRAPAARAPASAPPACGDAPSGPRAVPCRHPEPLARCPQRSPELGMSLDGGTAGGGLRPPVQAERRPAAVQQQLVAVRVVAHHPGEDADGHVLGLAGAQQRLLEVWGEGVKGVLKHGGEAAGGGGCGGTHRRRCSCPGAAR